MAEFNDLEVDDPDPPWTTQYTVQEIPTHPLMEEIDLPESAPPEEGADQNNSSLDEESAPPGADVSEAEAKSG